MAGVMPVRTLSVVSRGAVLWGQGDGLALSAAEYIPQGRFRGLRYYRWGRLGSDRREIGMTTGSRCAKYAYMLVIIADQASRNRNLYRRPTDACYDRGAVPFLCDFCYSE